MRKVMNRKAVFLILMTVWAFAAAMLTACSAGTDTQEKVKDLEISVMGEAELPEELQKIVVEKKTQPFKLTYSDDKNLYIAVGYGPQETGGYSISVKELYLTENSIVIDTELIGPEKGEAPASETSYPYIVVKTEYLELPMVFQ